MKKYSIYFSILFLIAAAGCSKEEAPTSSPDVKDPFIRNDNPNSQADHQIYLFYKETGIPVLYSDTLARNPLSTLNIGYHLTSLDSLVTVKYLTKEADILAGLDFVKTQVVPYLSKALKPYSVLLTDSVYTFYVDYFGSTLVPLNAYPGFNTLAISYASAIKDMSATRLINYRKDVLKTILIPKINENEALTTELYAVSKVYYNLTATGTIFRTGVIPYKPKETYGLLTDGTEDPSYYSTLGQAEDLGRYLDVALVLSPAQFETTYKNYPLVMQKYKLLMAIFKTLGFTLPV